MKKNILLIIIWSIIFQSCLSMKDMNTAKTNSIIRENQNNLNGIYSNSPNGILNNEAEDLKKLLLNPFYVYAWEEEKDYKGEIKITQISDKKIKVTYFKDDKLVKTKTLKGKFKNGFFIVKRKLRPIGIPFVFYTYKERRIMIGSDKEDNLIVKTGRYDFGMILFFGGGGKEINKYTFKKKKTSS